MIIPVSLRSLAQSPSSKVTVVFVDRQKVQIHKIAQRSNVFVDTSAKASKRDFDSILGLAGTLLNTDSQGISTYQWVDARNNIVDAVFDSRGGLIRWDTIGF